MKNLKVLFIMALVSLAVVSYADKKPKNVRTITKIAVEQVFTVPGLPGAVLQQVSPNLIKSEKKQTYYALVKHDRKAYYVYGSSRAWAGFFKIMPVKAQKIWLD
jgi:hypothetical protein